MCRLQGLARPRDARSQWRERRSDGHSSRSRGSTRQSRQTRESPRREPPPRSDSRCLLAASRRLRQPGREGLHLRARPQSASPPDRVAWIRGRDRRRPEELGCRLPLHCVGGLTLGLPQFSELARDWARSVPQGTCRTYGAELVELGGELLTVELERLDRFHAEQLARLLNSNAILTCVELRRTDEGQSTPARDTATASSSRRAARSSRKADRASGSSSVSDCDLGSSAT
jgi:hypothetical protein